jgi:hypothetical protein
MLGPIGFFSYASSDDENSRGRLSQLRQRLVGELQQQVGRSQKVQIFQDVASIPLGASWERQIREGLAASSFLIPILTPAFFQSEWCCREVLQFREREAVLGRDDLIFPIHYIDTDHLDPDLGDDCSSAEVYALLRTRQIANFRALRFKDYDSEAMLTALDGVAVGIRNALRIAEKPVAPPTSVSTADDANASTRPGNSIGEGLGGPPMDEREAARLLKLAAEQGNVRAHYELGSLYANGLGGQPQDHGEAARLFRLAADRGHPKAQFALAALYANGLGGLPQDEREAARLLRLAAALGDADAQHALRLYEAYVRDDLDLTRTPVLRVFQDFLSAQFDRRAIRLELVKRAPNAFLSTIKDRALFRDASFILEVSARRPLSDIQTMFPACLKVGPNTKMNEIIHAHLPGVPLVHLPTPPPHIGVIADHVYFYLDRTSPLWPEFGSASAVGMHVAGDWPELQIEFWAIRGSRG